MTLTCLHCNKNLPESSFYESSLKRGWRICKKCQNAKTKEATKRYLARKKDERKHAGERTFEGLFGGYTIIILNHVKTGEFRYSIKGTDGDFLQTNDLKVFKDKLNKIFNEKCYGSK